MKKLKLIQIYSIYDELQIILYHSSSIFPPFAVRRVFIYFYSLIIAEFLRYSSEISWTILTRTMLPGAIVDGSRQRGISSMLQSMSTKVANDFSMFPTVKVYSRLYPSFTYLLFITKQQHNNKQLKFQCKQAYLQLLYMINHFSHFLFAVLIFKSKYYNFSQKFMSNILLLIFLLFTCESYNPHKSQSALIPTLVTAWWPQQNQSKQSLPTGTLLTQFKKLLQLPFNMIIFGDQNFAKFVSDRRKGTNTKFIELDSTVLTNSWYFNQISELKKNGQKTVPDRISTVVAYSRMFLLNRAYENDAFNTDEFIWVDGNALASYQISKILQPKNIDSLLLAFKHHFFILKTDKNNEVHAYPNVQKTYFQTKFDNFVTTQLFGAKKESIPTINLIYEDILRVVVKFDGNLWCEDAIWSLLADRCPFLISYLSANDIKPPQTNRLLPEQENITFETQKKTLDYYQWMIGLCEMGIIFIAIIFAWEIIKFLRYASRRPQKEPINQSQAAIQQNSNALGSPNQ